MDDSSEESDNMSATTINFPEAAFYRQAGLDREDSSDYLSDKTTDDHLDEPCDVSLESSDECEELPSTAGGEADDPTEGSDAGNFHSDYDSWSASRRSLPVMDKISFHIEQQQALCNNLQSDS